MSLSTEVKKILVCTVGGSHAPILQALKDHQPDYTYFICSDGKQGSEKQISGQGKCIKASPKDEKPSLPNIPTQAKLEEGTYECLIVPSDNPDEVHHKCCSLFETLIDKYPDATIISDYTGGTKSMTAGLLLSSLEYSHIKPYLVSGKRSNLDKVVDGTQVSLPANVERIRFGNQWNIAMAPWSHFGYSESVVALENMTVPASDELRSTYIDSLAASRAFAAWDRFNHEEAYRLLEPQRSKFVEHISVLRFLTFDGDKKQEPSRLLDLKLNMLRRAERQLYDDAVSRAYRLLEWTAQWLLRRDADIDTGNIPVDKVPDSLVIHPNKDGILKAGLMQAWVLLETHGNEATRNFAKENGRKMTSYLTMRNESILAHGYTPVSESDWNLFHRWMEEGLFPLLETQAKESGIKKMPVQLPTSFPSK